MGQAAGKQVSLDMAEEDEPPAVGDSLEAKASRCCPTKSLRYGYVALGVITVLFSIWSIVVSLTGAVFHQRYNEDPSSRTIGLVMVIVSAFISISIIVSGSIALIKRKYNFMTVVGITLLVMAVFQAALAATSVRISENDEQQIGEALVQSFKLSRLENTKEHKLWSISQHDLQCCGLDGPDDYKDPHLPDYFAPSVPISCCPQYNPEKSEASQKGSRARCIFLKGFYKVGCKKPILKVFKTGSKVTTISLVILIVTEVLLSLLSALLYSRKKKYSDADMRNETNNKPSSRSNETKAKSPSPEPVKS